jgi:signal transduction histidine kinase
MKNYRIILCFCFIVKIFSTSTAIAQPKLDSLEQVLASYSKNDTIKVRLLTDIVKIYLQYSTKIDNASKLTEEALKLAESLQHPLSIAYALDTKGIYARSTAKYYEAIRYHEQALNIANQCKDISLRTMINNNIGVAYRRMGNNAAALPFHQESLRLARIANNEHNMTYSLNCLGNLFYQTGEYEKSLQQFKEAYNLDSKNKNYLGIAINLNNVGGIFRQKKSYDSALIYFQNSLTINKEIKNYKGIAICYDDIGTIYLVKKDYDKALDYFQRALRIINASKDIIYAARIYMHFGQVHLDRKEYAKAIVFFKKSIVMAKNIEAKLVMQDSYEYLSKTYQEMGDYKKSLENYKDFMLYKDSLRNYEKAMQMSYLQAKFEGESKTKEIQNLQQLRELQEAKYITQVIIQVGLIFVIITIGIILFILFKKNAEKQKQNRQLITQQGDLIRQKNEIQTQKDELDKANLVKDRLFSIIGHDLRSPFNTIKGFIAIMRVGGLTIEEIQDIATTIEQQLNYTLNLLNNLLYWSWSQMQGITANPTDFYINHLLETNVELLRLNASKKHISLRYEIDKKLRVQADENMIDTVVRNLLANALKFTHQHGEVVISYKDDTDRYVFCIADTGVGMTDTQLVNLFGVKTNSTIGTAHEKGTGLGLQICREFLEKNNGKIWVTSEVNKGSKFYFTLPKSFS